MSAWITTVVWAKVVSMIYWTTLQEFYHTVKEYQYEHVFTPVPTFMWFLRFKLTLSPNKLHPLPGDWRKIKLIVIANQHEDVEIFISTKNLAARRTGVSAAKIYCRRRGHLPVIGVLLLWQNVLKIECGKSISQWYHVHNDQKFVLPVCQLWRRQGR